MDSRSAASSSATTTATAAAAAAPPAGPADLQQVVYVSRAASGQGPAMLTDLLKVARRNNQAAAITGLLVCFDGRFLQYFEGPHAAVHDLLSLLRIDRRHEQMEVLLDAPAERRLFDRWDMRCLAVGSDGWQQLAAADWPRVQPVVPGARPGLEVLEELTRLPVAPVDRSRAFGAPGPARRETDIAVADPPPELQNARLNFALVTAIAVVLALVVLYQWLA